MPDVNAYPATASREIDFPAAPIGKALFELPAPIDMQDSSHIRAPLNALDLDLNHPDIRHGPSTVDKKSPACDKNCHLSKKSKKLKKIRRQKRGPPSAGESQYNKPNHSGRHTLELSANPSESAQDEVMEIIEATPEWASELKPPNQDWSSGTQVLSLCSFPSSQFRSPYPSSGLFSFAPHVNRSTRCGETPANLHIISWPSELASTKVLRPMRNALIILLFAVFLAPPEAFARPVSEALSTHTALVHAPDEFGKAEPEQASADSLLRFSGEARETFPFLEPTSSPQPKARSQQAKKQVLALSNAQSAPDSNSNSNSASNPNSASNSNSNSASNPNPASSSVPDSGVAPDLNSLSKPGEEAAESSLDQRPASSNQVPKTSQHKGSTPKPPYYRNELSLGVAMFSYQAFFRSTPNYIAGDLAFSRVFFPMSIGKRKTRAPEQRGIPVVLKGGLRWAPGPTRGLPLEIYAAALLKVCLGPWEPMAGPELGYSGFTQLESDREYRPDDFFKLEQERLSPLYLSFGVAPARFVIGRWSLSALEFQAGGSLSPLGAARRFHLEVLRVGWSL